MWFQASAGTHAAGQRRREGRVTCTNDATHLFLLLSYPSPFPRIQDERSLDRLKRRKWKDMIEPLFRPLITCPSAWFSLGCSTSFNYCCFVQTITVSKNCKFIESSSAYCPGVPGRFNILFHFVTITKLTITLSVADLLEPRLLPPTSISLPFRWLKELLKMLNDNVFFFRTRYAQISLIYRTQRRSIYISIMQTEFPRIKSADSRQTKIL